MTELIDPSIKAKKEKAALERLKSNYGFLLAPSEIDVSDDHINNTDPQKSDFATELPTRQQSVSDQTSRTMAVGSSRISEYKGKY